MKFILSLALMINMSMLVGLTQKSAAQTAVENIRSARQAATQLQSALPELRQAERQIAEMQREASGDLAAF